MATPAFNPHVHALPVHVCQKMGYDWIISDVTPDGFRGKRVLDFGPNGYPLLPLLAKWGADAWWHDRNPGCAATMANLAEKSNVIISEQKALIARPEFDIIVASNAIQHNHDGAETLYGRLVAQLNDGGRLYVVECLAHGKSYWDTGRADPCWRRTLSDHAALWAAAGLRLIRTALFHYGLAGGPDAAWVSPVNGDMAAATRVCARLERGPC